MNENNTNEVFEIKKAVLDIPSEPNVSSNEPPNTYKKSFGKKTVGIIAGILALAAVSLAAYMYMAVYSPKTVFKGVDFSGTSLGGMSLESAENAVKNTLEGLNIKDEIELEIGLGTFTVPTGIDKEKLDYKAIAKAAYEYGRQGSVFQRYNDIKRAKSIGFSIPLDIEVKRELIEPKVAAALEETERNSGEKLYELRGTNLVVNLAYGLIFDKDEIVQEVEKRAKALDFSVLKFQGGNTKRIDADTIISKVQKPSRDPSLDMNDKTGMSIIKGEKGIKIDKAQAEKAMEMAKNNLAVIPIEIIEPKYTDAQFKSMLFRDVLSSQSTSFNPNLTSRTKNISIAAKDSQTVVMPGEEFSYTKQVGRITRDKGYEDALVFNAGAVENGLGGGVCQVSSTIYMAAMYADMKIDTRRNHSFVVSYTPVGQDATFVYGGQDFKFKNNTEFPVKVVTSVGKSSLIVKIIGTKQAPTREIKVVTEVLSKNPFEVKTVYDPTLKPGERKVKNEGYTGYKANTYRVTYEDGKEISRVLEATSTYKRLDKVILVGTDPNAPVVKPEVPTEKPTEKPAETTASPTGATEKPAETTASPTGATEKPTETTANTTGTTAKPQ